tara:strand:- start:421 stop:648 length:228 start_codon:yes stop_codon:yes gene_type:complete
MFLKIEGHEGYVKDTNTGVVLNINRDEIEAAKKRKALKQQQEQDINNLKNEVSDIKTMLNTIIEKLDGSNRNNIK